MPEASFRVLMLQVSGRLVMGFWTKVLSPSRPINEALSLRLRYQVQMRPQVKKPTFSDVTSIGHWLQVSENDPRPDVSNPAQGAEVVLDGGRDGSSPAQTPSKSWFQGVAKVLGEEEAFGRSTFSQSSLAVAVSQVSERARYPTGITSPFVADT